MRRIDDFTEITHEALIRPNWLDHQFCHWVHCYFLERDLLPDEGDFHLLINTLLARLMATPQGRAFLSKTLDPVYPQAD